MSDPHRIKKSTVSQYLILIINIINTYKQYLIFLTKASHHFETQAASGSGTIQLLQKNQATALCIIIPNQGLLIILQTS